MGSSSSSQNSSNKVGSNSEAAKHFAGQGDFGVPESGKERDRAYVSAETRANDPGGIAERAGASDNRSAGVGGSNSGPGSSSGGDVDTDMAVLDPVSQSGPDDRTDGADMVSSDESVSGRFGAEPNDRPRVAGKSLTQHSPGEFVNRGGDVSTTGAQGASGTGNPQNRDDDSFAAEISTGEASGADN